LKYLESPLKVLISGASGKTGRHVIEALRRRPEAVTIRGVHRTPSAAVDATVDEVMLVDMDNPVDRAKAVAGMDTVVYYGPPFDPREVSMGTGVIDAALAANVRRFIYISVIHPGIADLMNHQAKQAVESHLLNTPLDWTILRPQHYMQNIDVTAAVRDGRLVFPWPRHSRLGHVDMRDLAEVTAKVVLEEGHRDACYDIAAGEHFDVDELAATITRLCGRAVEPGEMTAQAVLDRVGQHGPLPIYTVEALHRLCGYYARRGIRGNPNVLRWLLGREPTSFEGYVKRQLGLA
jgi:uncharacterized protein YbjT (DUF2867 family)